VRDRGQSPDWFRCAAGVRVERIHGIDLIVGETEGAIPFPQQWTRGGVVQIVDRAGELRLRTVGRW
jgi:hypothetical protein